VRKTETIDILHLQIGREMTKLLTFNHFCLGAGKQSFLSEKSYFFL